MALCCSQKAIKIIKSDFYFLKCFHSFTKILEFNQHQKSDKVTFLIYEDLECIIEKIVKEIYKSKNNSKNSSTAKVSKRIPSDFSMSTISSFRNRK